MPAPKSKPSRSPFGRQRHYGAVELAGASEQVNVNDVVEVTEKKQQQEPTQQHPALVQVRFGHTFLTAANNSERNNYYSPTYMISMYDIPAPSLLLL